MGHSKGKRKGKAGASGDEDDAPRKRGRTTLLKGERLKWMEKKGETYVALEEGTMRTNFFKTMAHDTCNRYGYDVDWMVVPEVDDQGELIPIEQPSLNDYSGVALIDEKACRKEIEKRMMKRMDNWFRNHFKDPTKQETISEVMALLEGINSQAGAVSGKKKKPKKPRKESKIDIYWTEKYEELKPAFDKSEEIRAEEIAKRLEAEKEKEVAEGALAEKALAGDIGRASGSNTSGDTETAGSGSPNVVPESEPGSVNLVSEDSTATTATSPIDSKQEAKNVLKRRTAWVRAAYEAETSAYKASLEKMVEEKYEAAEKKLKEESDSAEQVAADGQRLQARGVQGDFEPNGPADGYIGAWKSAGVLSKLVEAVSQRQGMKTILLMVGPLAEHGGRIGVKTVHSRPDSGLVHESWDKADAAGFAATTSSLVGWADCLYSHDERYRRGSAGERVKNGEIIPIDPTGESVSESTGQDPAMVDGTIFSGSVPGSSKMSGLVSMPQQTREAYGQQNLFGDTLEGSASGSPWGASDVDLDASLFSGILGEVMDASQINWVPPVQQGLDAESYAWGSHEIAAPRPYEGPEGGFDQWNLPINPPTPVPANMAPFGLNWSEPDPSRSSIGGALGVNSDGAHGWGYPGAGQMTSVPITSFSAVSTASVPTSTLAASLPAMTPVSTPAISFPVLTVSRFPLSVEDPIPALNVVSAAGTNVEIPSSNVPSTADAVIAGPEGALEGVMNTVPSLETGAAPTADSRNVRFALPAEHAEVGMTPSVSSIQVIAVGEPVEASCEVPEVPATVAEDETPTGTAPGRPGARSRRGRGGKASGGGKRKTAEAEIDSGMPEEPKPKHPKKSVEPSARVTR
ncbi:hypothetical protein C8J56DRAFT_1057713 [Mycena floridula]|nr:hypothetical protein C8J56DRAFT_1057713 [Mycena floridula]